MNTAIKETKRDRIFKIFNYSILTVAMVVVLYPLIFILSASISDPAAVNSGRMWLYPIDITFEGYQRVFNNPQIWNGYKNTIFYTVLGTFINLLVTLPAAFALSRRGFIGRNFFMTMFVVTMFLSGGLIPSYLLVKNLGLMNTVWALVLPNAATVWHIIVCRTFFQYTIPEDLEDAAKIDGASILHFFGKVVLPLSTPIIAVMALFYGVDHWNSYFNAMIYISDTSKYPLQLVLREILVLQEMSTNVNNLDGAALQNQANIAAIMKYAVMIVATLPLIIVYPFMQRFFVQGVMIGSVKG
ncbi:carbohydrate ABC transporter permease [Sporosarcina sp. ANT_H38]|uniref:carbohydrate ABC transporter permease n=1 Tax=Sporosarcina sp. ANT_H38 TaxID=2597358 RepID=UPI0011F3A830|nr:carbohydrate ABC transporter permease [Sporosarcina sp. ANT_H38]KAA0965549.1 carbohydrate ABC transporter permease [Sporosarcina sp. ANT_H38]